MGSAGWEKARSEFDQQHVIDVTLATYDRLLGRGYLASTVAPGVKLRFARLSDAPLIAALHGSELADSFLSSLGEDFLVRLYRRVIRSSLSFAIVASTDESTMVGFVTGTEDTGLFYRQFLAIDGFAAGMEALPNLRRSPRRVLETLRYGSVPPAELGDLPAPELLSLAVAPGARRKGVGRALVGSFQLELARRGLAASRVVVAAGNTAAIGLYAASGFRHARSFELHHGGRSEVLVWP
jgi:ribosomal protein S18 acetylase RimI-like enzyme